MTASARETRYSGHFVGGLGALNEAAGVRSQQHECVAKLGILMQYAERDVDFLGRLASFRGQLRKLGWIENRDLEIEERCSGDDVQRIK
jgi:S-formylglutathione hydrolase FrmB